jgi:outer membrane protein TolC
MKYFSLFPRFLVALSLGLSPALPATAVAQSIDLDSLSLDDCRRLAMANNASVKMARADYRAADQLTAEAFTKYFPQVSAQGFYGRTDRPVINYDVADLFRVKLIRGLTVAGVTAVQPLFAGGRIVNANRLAKVGKSAADLKQQAAVNQALVTVERYFWQLATLRSQRHTLEGVVALTDTLSRQVKVAVDAGVTTRNDLLKVELRRNEYLSSMATLDNAIVLTRSLLAQYIGYGDTSVDIALPTIAPATIPPFPSDIYIKASETVAATVDYRLLQRGIEAGKLQVDLAVGENLPSVALGAGYFYDRLLSQDNHYGALFVTISVPISAWWGGSHAITRRKIELQNAKTQMADACELLQIKIDSAWDDLCDAYRQMQLASQAIEQSLENLRLNQNYYLAGTSTISDLLDAQTLYRQSCDRYTQAFGDFCLKRTLYLDASGRLPWPD